MPLRMTEDNEVFLFYTTATKSNLISSFYIKRTRGHFFSNTNFKNITKHIERHICICIL